MQPVETAALVLFLISYFYSGVRALLTPAGYREEEVRFYSGGGMKFDEYIVFGTGALSFAAVIVHLILETPKVGEIILYGQVAMFVLVLPFHFIGLFKARMVATLKKKTDSAYRNAGLLKLIVGAAMIAAPFIIPG